MLEIKVLGDLQVLCDGAALALPPSRKTRGLLAYLALTRRPHRREQLCEMFWDVPDDPRGSLRWGLSKIRRLVDEPDFPRLMTDRQSVELRTGGLDIDFFAAQRCVEGTSLTGDLARAASTFRGPLLAELELADNGDFHSWLLGLREDARQLQAKILGVLVDRLRASPEEALRYARELVRIDPFDENIWAQLITILASSGRHGEVRQQYEAGLRSLREVGGGAGALLRAWRAVQSATVHPVVARGITIPAGDANAVQPSIGGGGPDAAKNSDAANNSTEPGAAAEPHLPGWRASVAVLPFEAETRTTGTFADGLSHDITSGLARLRTFLVIARGSTFALRDRLADPREIGRALGVDYTTTGSVCRRGGRLRVSAELCSTADGRVIWTNTFEGERARALELISNITAEIIGLLDSEITSAECNRAILKPTNSLNAWELYHRALWHMYRFTNYDNTCAQTYFKHAIKLDPTFARAYAGLSFTHWQSAWLFKSGGRQIETQHAFDVARLGMLADCRDPGAHWAMGRALWLLGEDAASTDELNVAVSLSPNFAIGHYTLGFVEAQTGDPEIAIAETDLARRLSPLDPMLYAMYAARAFALFRLERFEEAAEWAFRAAHKPNAHAHVHAIAAFALACADRLEESRREAGVLHHLRPGYCIEDFFSAFRVHGNQERIYRAAARQIGIG